MNKIIQGDSLGILSQLPNSTFNTCVTSPPYWGLRDYGVDGQLGLEETPEQYVQNMVEVFREVRRVLRDDGTLWLNLGDSYCSTAPGTKTTPLHIKGLKKDTAEARARYRPQNPEGMKPKDLVGIPWMVAFALRADGWYLRSDIIWSKPNPMPESVRDRPTKSHEYIFLLSKSPKYYYDSEAIKEDAVNGDPNPPRGSVGVINNPSNQGIRKQDELGKRTYTGFNERYVPLEKRNKRSVWTITTKPYKEAHFATFPPDLIEPCILAGCPEGGRVLDPFFGSGTTGQVAMKNNRNFTGIELNPEYIEIAKKRLQHVQPVFSFNEVNTWT
jgi:DNA modification methylase